MRSIKSQILVLFISLIAYSDHPAIAAPAQGPSVAAIYLKLDGFTGASTAENHAGEIELVSFNWSETNKDKSKPEPHDALILKAIDANTPKLAEAVATLNEEDYF